MGMWGEAYSHALLTEATCHLMFLAYLLSYLVWIFDSVRTLHSPLFPFSLTDRMTGLQAPNPLGCRGPGGQLDSVSVTTPLAMPTSQCGPHGLQNPRQGRVRVPPP